VIHVEKQQFEAIQAQLDKMTKLLALMALSKEEKESEKIRLLDSMGFRPTEIAKILNKTLSNVTKTLTVMRKKDRATNPANEPESGTPVATEGKPSE
jgi:DNA-binding MarR family transcriptional regulator